MKNNLLEYLSKSSLSAKKQHKEATFLGNIYIFIKDHIIGDVNLDNVLKKVKNSIPIHLCKMFNIDEIIPIGVDTLFYFS